LSDDVACGGSAQIADAVDDSRGGGARLFTAEIQRKRAAEQKAMVPIAIIGKSDPAALDRIVIRTSKAAAAALNPMNMMSARPFTPSRSLSQPLTSTDTAPTPGKMALMRAASPLL
jgi:hypothetical protein